MNRRNLGKAGLVGLTVYASAMLGLSIPRADYASLSIPIWILPAILLVAWLTEGLKPDAIQIGKTNICLTPSGALIPLAIALFFGFQLMYLMPFAIGLLIMAGLMFKLSKPDFLKGIVRFKPSYALAISYGAAAFAALLMYGTADFALNIKTLAPLAGAVGTAGILIGNIATGLELSSQKATPATYKQKIVLGANGVCDVLWIPLFIALILFTIPAILAELHIMYPALQQYLT
jgi:hypothetical protein